MRVPTALILAALAAPLTAGLARAEVIAPQKAEIEKIVHDYLLEKPEIIKEAIDVYEKRQHEKSVRDAGDALMHSPNQAVVGNPNGDVTLVEFFDYNCGYCKQSLATVAKLIAADPKLRVVLKDFPILGSDSIEIAQAATALRAQVDAAKFWEFHKKLLSTRGHLNKAQALAAAKEVGADVARLEKDMASPATQDALKEVASLADTLGFTGTPAWVVGNQPDVGGQSYEHLKTKIDNTRKCGKAQC